MHPFDREEFLEKVWGLFAEVLAGVAVLREFFVGCLDLGLVELGNGGFSEKFLGQGLVG